MELKSKSTNDLLKNKKNILFKVLFAINSQTLNVNYIDTIINVYILRFLNMPKKVVKKYTPNKKEKYMCA